jgi:hypothetical protein
MDIVSIFCAIDDFCELSEPCWQQHLLAAAPKQRDRKPRLCLSEVLTISLVFICQATAPSKATTPSTCYPTRCITFRGWSAISALWN